MTAAVATRGGESVRRLRAGPLFFLLPALVPVVLFSVVPLIEGIYLGFTDAKAGLNVDLAPTFLDNYVRLRDRGIRPFFCVNHGPTTSMYYRDPDGNRVELQIDNFATAKEGQDWMLSPAFDRNPIGVEYDPDDLVKRFKAGVPVAELVVRD